VAIVVLIGLVLVGLIGQRIQGPRIAISFAGYTNEQSGAPLAVIQLANRGNRFVDYSLGTAQVIMRDGQWKEVGEPILATMQELRPKAIDRVLVPLPAGADIANWRVPVSYVPYSTKPEEWIRTVMEFLQGPIGTRIYRIYSRLGRSGARQRRLCGFQSTRTLSRPQRQLALQANP
jgi:hypothetical protein